MVNLFQKLDEILPKYDKIELRFKNHEINDSQSFGDNYCA